MADEPNRRRLSDTTVSYHPAGSKPPLPAAETAAPDAPSDAGANPFTPSVGDAELPPRVVETPPSIDPSIAHEPHLLAASPVQQGEVARLAAEAEHRADLKLAVDADLSDADQVEHTVWDEPALSGKLAGGAPDGQLTYARWLADKIGKTSAADTWRTTTLVALAAGPWGVLGALISQVSGGGLALGGVLAAIVLAPVTEEITKLAAALWVVEKQPYRFKSAGQIMLCAAAGGLAFAAIENVIYLAVYNPGGGPSYAAWRWVVCTALHVTCSLVAGLGLVEVWRGAITAERRPDLTAGTPWFAGAMVLHGLYNATVTLAEAAGVLTFE